MILIFVSFLVIDFIIIKSLFESKEDYKRLKYSIGVANNQIEYFRAKNGELISKVDVMILTQKELKNIYPEIITEIDNLNLKTRHLEQFSEAVISNDRNIITLLKDSIIYDTISIKAFNYSDKHFSVNGIVQSDSLELNISSIDSITQVVFKGERKRPWLWVLSRRKLQQIIKSSNPNSKIIYSKFIEVEK